MKRDAEPEAIEAMRQQTLLAALEAPRSSADDSPGVRAYRANAGASAERSLGAAFPTVRALLGGEAFAQLAREFRHADPPRRGDLGEWGETLPAWLAGHAGLAEWPYLADCARLDWAMHRCERAADASFDAASLGLLASAEPGRVHLRLMPGIVALDSRWPLASVHAAHAGGDERLFDAAREAIRRRQGEAVVVARSGWRGVVHRVDAAFVAFMHALASGADLAQALDAAGAGFDFAAWLTDALRWHWLQGATLGAEPGLAMTQGD